MCPLGCDKLAVFSLLRGWRQPSASWYCQGLNISGINYRNGYISRYPSKSWYLVLMCLTHPITVSMIYVSERSKVLHTGMISTNLLSWIILQTKLFLNILLQSAINETTHIVTSTTRKHKLNLYNHGWWWAGDARDQGIRRQDIALPAVVYMNIHGTLTWRTNDMTLKI